MSVGRISLNGLEFFSNHGWYEEEREKGGKYLVDFSFDIDISKASISDDLKDTLNYEEIYRMIAEEMAIPAKLIEHLAERIVFKLRRTFPQMVNIELNLEKINPPIHGKLRSVGILLKRE